MGVNKVTSAYNLWSYTQFSGAVGAEQELTNQLVCTVPWGILPGTKIRAGFSGHAVVGAGGPVRLRVRVGDAIDNSEVTGFGFHGGTVAWERTLAAGSTTDIGDIATDPVDKPSGNRAFCKYIVTAEGTTGTSSLTLDGAVASVVPSDGVGQGLYLPSTVLVQGGGGTETLAYEWNVDFSQFANVQNLLVGFSGEFDAGLGGPFRVRVGGTVGAGAGTLNPDGTVLLSYTGGGLTPAVNMRPMGGAIASVPFNLSGVQPVKFTIQNFGGGRAWAVALQEAF